MRLVLAILLALPLSAMDQLIPFGTNGAVSTSATRFHPISGLYAVTTTRDATRGVVPTNGTFGRLCVQLSADPTPGQYTVMVEKGTADTAVTLTITAGNTSGCTSGLSFSVTAGETVNYQIDPASSPASVIVRGSIIFTSSTANESILMSFIDANTMATGAASYNRLSGKNSTWDATQTNREQLVATGGTFKKLYVWMSAAPGTAASGKSYTFKLYIAASGSTLTCQVLDDATTCNDTSNTPSATAGNSASMESVPASTPTARAASYAVVFAPTTDGESLLMGGTTGAWNTGVALYATSTQGITPGNEADVRMAGQTGVTLKKLYFKITTAPGAGNDWTIRSRIDSGNGNITCQIAGASDVTCNDTSNTDALSDNTLINISNTPNSTPSASGVSAWGLVAYIDPASGTRRRVVVSQ